MTAAAAPVVEEEDSEEEQDAKAVAGTDVASIAAAALANAQKRAKKNEVEAETKKSAGPQDATVAAVVASMGSGTRFFIRGVGKLQEHHLKDYFQKFGEVVEATLVRDKKTKRPRGMAFIQVTPRPGTSEAEMVESLTSEPHTVGETELEIQEALPNPKQEEAPELAALGAAAGTVAPKGIGDAPAKAPVAASVEDPEAAKRAQAQWQMHYLALAINASVPEVGTLTAKQPPALPPAGLKRPASRGGQAAPKAPFQAAGGAHKAPPGVPPKAGKFAAAPWRSQQARVNPY